MATKRVTSQGAAAGAGDPVTPSGSVAKKEPGKTTPDRGASKTTGAPIDPEILAGPGSSEEAFGEEPAQMVAPLPDTERYQQLIHEEKVLLAHLHTLEREIAELGALEALASQELRLANARAALAQLRKEIELLEQQLNLEQRAYDEAKAAYASQATLDLHQERIKTLEAEIEHKRQLAEIYQAKVRYLELQQAQYGGQHVQISLVNDLNETHKQLRQTRDEIARLDRERHLPSPLHTVESFDPEPSQPTPDVHRLRVAALLSSSNLAPSLVEQLHQYNELRHRERQQLLLTSLLARKYALYGPHLAPFHLKRELERERQKLAQLQAEIKQLTDRLTEVPKADVQEADIESLRIDIEYKEELARIYTENIRYLEVQLATYGEFEQFDLTIMIQETARLRQETYQEIQKRELELEQSYSVSREWLNSFKLLSA